MITLIQSLGSFVGNPIPGRIFDPGLLKTSPGTTEQNLEVIFT